MKTGSKILVFGVFLAALGAGSYFLARLAAVPEGEEGEVAGVAEEAEPDTADLEPGEILVKVREHEIGVYAEFAGRVFAEGRHVVRAPEGMIVPIVKIHKEQGDVVKKGDVLIEFYEPAIHKAIADAEAAGDEAQVKRFKGYLDHVKLRSQIDGQVLQIDTQEGWTPLNSTIGMGLMVLADESSYAFKVDIPARSVRDSAFLGAKLQVHLEVEPGMAPVKVEGTVAHFERADDEETQRVVLQLPPSQGVERDLRGVVRIPVGKSVVGRMPKRAVLRRTPVPIARVWDPVSRSFAERTLVLGESIAGGPESGPEGDVIVTAGVLAGESVVVPENAPRR